jgi:hypothetical protein
VVEEIIGRLPELTEAQIGRLEDEIRRERQRRASSAGGGGRDAPHHQEDTAPSVTEVLEDRLYEDGYLQLELRRYIRRDGSVRERGPYWYFQFHEGVSARSSTSLLSSLLLSCRASRPVSGPSALHMPISKGG